MVASQSFEEFAGEFGLNQKVIDAMMFERSPPDENGQPTLLDLRRFKLMNCCLKTIRMGSVLPIASTKFQVIESSVDDKKVTTFSNRIYPSALPGPFSVQNSLYWAS